MKKLILLLLLAPCLLFSANTQVFDKDGIPIKPSPSRFVNIIEGAPNTFTSKQLNQLESELIQFSKSTGIQIMLAIVPNLNGYKKAQMAIEIGRKWAKEENGRDSGIVLLLKPKAINSQEYVFIAIGSGLEQLLPKEIGARIVEFEMMPEFIQNDYSTGISKSIQTLNSIALKETSASEYLSKTEHGISLWTILPLLVIILVFIVLRIRRENRRNYSSSAHPFWTTLFLGGSVGKGSHGSWSDFSGSAGGIDGFGGGGAKGSW